jgi:hypothetical protein
MATKPKQPSANVANHALSGTLLNIMFKHPEEFKTGGHSKASLSRSEICIFWLCTVALWTAGRRTVNIGK